MADNNKFELNPTVSNDLKIAIKSFEEMRKGKIGIADECVEQICKNALDYTSMLENKIKECENNGR